MANLIIKPTSGGSLILQDEGGTAANTIDASGNTQLAGTLGVTGNVTMSGTANNLGTATAGTLGSAVVFPAGHIVQIKNVQTGAMTTGTTQMAKDDTIPQQTEGTQWMTLAITPTSATNKLLIQSVINIGNSASQHNPVALFQDSTADALAVSFGHKPDVYGNAVILVHYMTAGTTSATTFKIRSGMGTAGTTTFNGMQGARQFGGVMASSITITEIKV